MLFHIPDRAKTLWDEWNLRTAVLVSLLFQVVLIFSAGSRKRRGSGLPMAFIWTFYLLADWIAAFAVGLIISSGQANNCPQNSSAVSQELAVFWAPFLLLHLGGPDAITAFSLEDNELWIRHLLGLIAQLVAVIYVFFQYSSNDQFLVPTVLMFLAGAFKYAERTRALYQACLGNFKSSLLPKPDAGPNYAQLMEEYSAMEASNVPVKIDIVREPERAGLPNNDIPISPETSSSTDMEIVVNGYKFFNIFKGLIVDHMFSFHERNESRAFFFQHKAADAFRVLEVELNFMYDSLYTKMAVINSPFGYVLRVICTVFIVVCFQQFASHPQHSNNITLFDKIVTYILLSGAVFLDLVASINLIFSDWTTVLAPKWAASLVLSMRPAPFTKRRQSRWSNAMSQHSFISFCLDQRPRWLEAAADLLGIKDILDEFQYKGSLACEEELKEFIFNELKAKAEKAQTIKLAKEICSARGDWVLLNYPAHYSYPSISSSVSDQEVEYDESLLLWHVATELCYSNSTKGGTNNRNRKFCKLLSDYMLYLLVMRPTLMSAVAGIAQIRFADTCEEAKKFFQRWDSELISPLAVYVDDGGRRSFLCEKLMNVKTVVKPIEVKGDRSKSVLFDACILANDLNKLDEVRRWEMMSRVWVELLSYGASHCRANEHARELSKGGELITFVWLQMAHFGLGEQFRIEAGHARAKLLYGK